MVGSIPKKTNKIPRQITSTKSKTATRIKKLSLNPGSFLDNPAVIFCEVSEIVFLVLRKAKIQKYLTDGLKFSINLLLVLTLLLHITTGVFSLFINPSLVYVVDSPSVEPMQIPNIALVTTNILVIFISLFLCFFIGIIVDKKSKNRTQYKQYLIALFIVLFIYLLNLIVLPIINAIHMLATWG